LELDAGEILLTLSREAADEHLRLAGAWTVLTSNKQITVVLGRFDDLLLGGLRELLGRDPTISIVADDVEQMRLSVVLSGHRPDVAILDADALARLVEVQVLGRRHPQTSLVVLAKDPSAAECAQLLAFGASACLGTETEGRDVLNAVHLASRGMRLMPGGVTSPDGPAGGKGRLLTRRESEVLPLLREGRSNAEIALSLHVGVETVRTHTRHIYRKLGVSSRRELVAPPRPDLVEPSVSSSHEPRRPAAMLARSRQRGHGSRSR
jgi:DNA-binding NarL/FixJ family response regulator